MVVVREKSEREEKGGEDTFWTVTFWTLFDTPFVALSLELYAKMANRRIP